MRILRSEASRGKGVHIRSTSHRALLGNPYLRELKQLQRSLPHWNSPFCATDEEKVEHLVRISVVGSYLTDKYAWAVPDERALKILAAFQPLVEIGCGKGYWARMLHDRGVDIMAVDKMEPKQGNWTYTLQGGPEVLQKRVIRTRSLFLCYPDEDADVAMQCLEYFSGEHVIHVGELISTGTKCGSEQRPWGRSSSSAFQEKLMEEFHCILVIALPSFPIADDYLTVWKRTEFTHGADEEQGDDDVWAAIPVNERLSQERAAKCAEHLLLL